MAFCTGRRRRIRCKDPQKVICFHDPRSKIPQEVICFFFFKSACPLIEPFATAWEFHEAEMASLCRSLSPMFLINTAHAILPCCHLKLSSIVSSCQPLAVMSREHRRRYGPKHPPNVFVGGGHTSKTLVLKDLYGNTQIKELSTGIH